MAEETGKGLAGIAGPVVHDLARPAAKELGAAGQRVVHALLLPLYHVLGGWEAGVNRVAEMVSEKLRGVPEAEIQAPAAYIAGPALEAIRFAMDEEELRALYAGLLASTMHTPSASNAHPSFVEIIKQMNIVEARLMHALSDLEPRVAVHLTGLILTPGSGHARKPIARAYNRLDDEIGSPVCRDSKHPSSISCASDWSRTPMMSTSLSLKTRISSS